MASLSLVTRHVQNPPRREPLCSHSGYGWPLVIQFQQVSTGQSNSHVSVNAPICIAGFSTNRLIGNFNVISMSERACAINIKMKGFISRLEWPPKKVFGTKSVAVLERANHLDRSSCGEDSAG